MQKKVVRITERKDFKVVAISDVHGHYEVLERLIDKLHLAPEDYLIILGDFINKGVDSYLTYEYVRKLAKRDRTYILKGNHEYLLGEWMKSEDEFINAYDIILRGFGRETIVHAILNRHGLHIYSLDGKQLYCFLHKHYYDVFSYFRKLPVVLHFNNHIFVHARYDENFTLPHDEYKFLKYYCHDEIKENKEKVVVGHLPNSNNPFFGFGNYIFIDGGMGVLKDGKLNAFIINCKDGEISYSFKKEEKK